MVKPLVSSSILAEDGKMLLDVQHIICAALRDCPNFKCVMFKEVDDGILIEGYQDKIPKCRHIVGMIKKDYSNINDAVWAFIQEWRDDYDSRHKTSNYKQIPESWVYDYILNLPHGLSRTAVTNMYIQWCKEQEEKIEHGYQTT